MKSRWQAPQPVLHRLQRLQDVLQSSENWLAHYGPKVPRLALEAETLGRQLQRAKARTQRLVQQANRPTTLALFGQSGRSKQALLAEMVGDAQGELHVRVGERTLSYARHINPTMADFAVSLRFTQQHVSASPEWPVALVLLNEVELTGLMLAARKSPVVASGQVMVATLERLQRMVQPQMTSDLKSEDLLMLWQNQRQQPGYDSQLDRLFWPQAMKLAPWLATDDRIELFALLWPGEDTLSDRLRQLLHLRQQLGYARRIEAEAELLVSRSSLASEWLLSHDADAQQTVMVRAQANVPPLPVSLADLRLLVLELELSLSSVPRQALFDEADMLLLPACARTETDSSLLSHKRELMSGWYAARHGIDVLLVCTASQHRTQTASVSHRLREWLRHQPALEKPRLIWAITPHDSRHQQENNDEAVQRQVGTPGQSWGSMLALDRAGVDRMSRWLQDEMTSESQQQLLSRQVQQLESRVAGQLLQPWCESEASSGQALRKKQIADALLKCLQHRTGLHGELLDRLQPSRDVLRQLWLGQQAQAADPAPQHFGIGFEFDLFSDQDAAGAATQNAPSPLTEMAQRVLGVWFTHLRQLPDNSELLALLNLDRDILAALTEELICASFRLDLLAQLDKALQDNLSGTRSAGQIDRLVSRAMTVIGDFVAWLGWLQQPELQRPASRVNRGQAIFARPALTEATAPGGQRLTRLTATPANTTAFYIYDWLVGLDQLVASNNGFTGGQALTPDARTEVLRLLQQLRS